MIDLHSHVLPGVDDGAPDLPGALRIAEAAAASGTRVLAATPHVRGLRPLGSAEIARLTAELNAALGERGVAIEIVPAGEVAMTTAVDLPDEELRALTFAGNGWLLLESPYDAVPGFAERAIFDARVRGVKVLLAHPERSPVFHSDPDSLGRLVEGGVRCSITASSLTGRFGRTVQRFAVELLTRGIVHNVASDSHDPEKRPPDLSRWPAAVGLAGDDPFVSELVESVPAAILAGEDVPERVGQLARKRFGRGRLR